MIRPNPVTLQLRYLQALNDVSGHQASTIVFPLPLDMIGPLLGRSAGRAARTLGPKAPTPSRPSRPDRGATRRASLTPAQQSEVAELERRKQG